MGHVDSVATFTLSGRFPRWCGVGHFSPNRARDVRFFAAAAPALSLWAVPFGPPLRVGHRSGQDVVGQVVRDAVMFRVGDHGIGHGEQFAVGPLDRDRGAGPGEHR